jgi:hypothetical protein
MVDNRKTFLVVFKIAPKETHFGSSKIYPKDEPTFLVRAVLANSLGSARAISERYAKSGVYVWDVVDVKEVKDSGKSITEGVQIIT